MVALDKRGISVDGKYRVLLCASFFYFRIPREKWEERANALVASGCNAVDIYFPWNYHELAPGQYTFEGNADADEFLRLCTEKGLMIIARPGPYICSEWDGGAIPAWIVAKGNVRSANPEFIADTRKWYERILPIIKKYEYDGHGGVILMQLDNELDFFDCPDPEAYIGQLRDIAREEGITVPLFACAGQLCAERAGGLTDGVYPTYNFYPDSFDAGYDSVFRYYTDTLAERDKPLLVSETNRDAFLMRREYAAGAKLLGMYNQVGGSNFGFTASVNNWGNPLAFLSTLYDFDSMVNTLGEYTPEVDKFRIFDSFLRSLGERAATALPYRGDVKVKADFTAAENTNALELDDGGVIVCLSCFDKEGEAEVEACGKSVKAHLHAGESLFLPFGVKYGNLTVECANCEPLAYDGKTLTLHTDFTPYAMINGRVIEKDTTVDGVAVRFISDEEAAVFGRKDAVRAPKKHVTYSVPVAKPVEYNIGFTLVGSGAQPLDAVGVYRGYASYTAYVAPGKKIFVEDASDIITAYIDNEYYDTKVLGGVCEIYPASTTGNARFVAEKWGNSNFDDSRLPSIRLTARKGIHGIYAVESERKLRQMRFTLAETYGGEVETRGREPQTMICNDKWNTTRMPAICAYSFETVREHDKLYIHSGSDSELCVYVNGKYAGAVDYKYFDLTPYCPQGESVTVTAEYRKRHWAEAVGELTLIELSRAEVSMSVLKDTDFAQIPKVDAKDGQVKLPYKLARGKTYVSAFELKRDKDVYVEMKLRDCKATIVSGGKALARVMGEWSGSPEVVGGSREIFYVPAEWVEDKQLRLFIECVGDNPAVEKIKIIQKN